MLEIPCDKYIRAFIHIDEYYGICDVQLYNDISNLYRYNDTLLSTLLTTSELIAIRGWDDSLTTNALRNSMELFNKYNTYNITIDDNGYIVGDDISLIYFKLKYL